MVSNENPAVGIAGKRGQNTEGGRTRKGFAPEESDRAAMTGPGYYSKHGRQAVSTVTGHTIQDWKAPVNDVSLSI